jgi:hypothetical protein
VPQARLVVREQLKEFQHRDAGRFALFLFHSANIARLTPYVKGIIP